MIILSKKVVFVSLKINFVLANSEGSYKMSHNAAFYLGLHCLQKYLFRGSGLQRDIVCLKPKRVCICIA